MSLLGLSQTCQPFRILWKTVEQCWSFTFPRLKQGGQSLAIGHPEGRANLWVGQSLPLIAIPNEGHSCEDSSQCAWCLAPAPEA
jgi:hypothetical protein